MWNYVVVAGGLGLSWALLGLLMYSWHQEGQKGELADQE